MGDWYDDVRLWEASNEREQAFQDEPNAQPIGPDVCWECGHEVHEGQCQCKEEHWA